MDGWVDGIVSCPTPHTLQSPTCHTSHMHSHCNTSQHSMFSHTSISPCQSKYTQYCPHNILHHHNPYLPCSAAIKDCSCLQCRQPSSPSYIPQITKLVIKTTTFKGNTQIPPPTKYNDIFHFLHFEILPSTKSIFNPFAIEMIYKALSNNCIKMTSCHPT